MEIDAIVVCELLGESEIELFSDGSDLIATHALTVLAVEECYAAGCEVLTARDRTLYPSLASARFAMSSEAERLVSEGHNVGVIDHAE